MKFKYLAIDIGNVICHLEFDSFNKKLAKHANISEEEANAFLFSSQKAHDLGFSILENDLNNKFYNLNLTPEQIREVVDEWHKTVVPNVIVMEWLEKLLDQGVKIALLSNVGFEHAETMKNILDPIYNKVIKFFSCDAGCRKPNYIYYNLFLNMYPQFRGCLYMDDNEANITTGRLFDFMSIQFDLSKMTNEEIKDRLLKLEKEVDGLTLPNLE